MHDIGRAFLAALNLIGSLDTELIGIVGLSLQVSLTATLIAMAIGAPMAGLLAVSRFRGQQAVIVAANAMLGLPPVAVGLFVYLLLSRSGPLGFAGLLFSPMAMIIAQAVLATPIVVAIAHRALATLWLEYGDALQIDGASRARSVQ